MANPTTNEMCKRCSQRRAALHAYWGPPLCRPCARAVAGLLDKHDKWPAVPWSDEELEELAG